MLVSVHHIKDYLEENNIQFNIVNELRMRGEYELASLKCIIPSGLYYLEREYLEHCSKITKSLIITNAAEDELSSYEENVFLIVDKPQLLFYSICRMVMPPAKTGIHPTAIIDSDASVGVGCYIGPYTVIGKCIIEENCQIDAHVIIGDDVIVKRNTTIEPNSYIGAHGVAWIWGSDSKRVIQPQYGGVVVEEDCFIGSDVSIVRGSVNENTIIGRGTLIAHGTKIGHGAYLGENCHLANNVSLAGNSKVGARSFLGAGCVLSSHVSIAEDCVIGAGAVVTKSFQESNILLAGVPAKVISKITNKEKLNGIPQRK